MSKLTPARKALLQKLVDAGFSLSCLQLTPSERASGTRAQKDGLCFWRTNFGVKRLHVSQSGYDALQSRGEQS